MRQVSNNKSRIILFCLISQVKQAKRNNKTKTNKSAKLHFFSANTGNRTGIVATTFGLAHHHVTCRGVFGTQ